jgi:hypothetical protein
VSGATRVIGVVLFFGVLYVVDSALARWGSAAIRRRPRAGLRVTLVFVAVLATYTLLGFLAGWVSAWSVTLGWAVLALAFPATTASAIAVDRLLPERRTE